MGWEMRCRKMIKSVMLGMLLFSPAYGAALAQALPSGAPRISSNSDVENGLQLTAGDEAVFVFGGRYHTGFYWDSFAPGADFEDNFALAVGYQKFYQIDPNGWNFGLEVGFAARFGENPATAEFWAGGVGRYDGWILGDAVRVSPSMTVGLSAVTDTMGVEKDREAGFSKPANLLFYLGPELDFSLVDHPEYEVFWRAHHRSGGWGLTGFPPIDAANAVMGGVRIRF